MTDVDWANMPEPTKCYAFGCPAENELLLHLSADPDGFADLCLAHARIEAT